MHLVKAINASNCEKYRKVFYFTEKTTQVTKVRSTRLPLMVRNPSLHISLQAGSHWRCWTCISGASRSLRGPSQQALLAGRRSTPNRARTSSNLPQAPREGREMLVKQRQQDAVYILATCTSRNAHVRCSILVNHTLGCALTHSNKFGLQSIAFLHVCAIHRYA